MKIKLMLVALLTMALLLAQAGCAAVVGSDLMKDVQAEGWPQTADEPDPAYTASTNDFAWRLLLESMGSQGNVLVSPPSVYLALAMTLNGANHETRDAMLSALSADGLTVEAINRGSRNWMINLDNENDFDLTIANSIWIRDGYNVDPDFLQVNADHYAAAARQLDFALPSAIDAINGWVKDQTEDTIAEIIDEIDPASVMFLINAIYFLADWETKFSAEDTADNIFQTPKGDKTVEFMKRTGDLTWINDALCDGLVLPYAGERFALVALLPDPAMTARDLVTQLSAGTFSELMASQTTEPGQVMLPKFELAFKTSLKPALSAMGMGVAFGGQADLSLMNEERAKNLFIGDVLHKTFIRVDEEGTEASAVTVVDIRLTSAPEINRSIVFDRPFVFCIMDTHTDSPLFIGILEDPS